MVGGACEVVWTMPRPWLSSNQSGRLMLAAHTAKSREVPGLVVRVFSMKSLMGNSCPCSQELRCCPQTISLLVYAVLRMRWLSSLRVCMDSADTWIRAILRIQA
eukprot:6476018-Amphidinium_carterae.2